MNPTSSKPRIVPAAPGEVRLIGGQWRRAPVPVVDTPGLRPTPGRVRQTVFDWLHHLWGGEYAQRSVLDLFAGSGALGLEAASRGVGRVVCVDNANVAAGALRRWCERRNATQVLVRQADARLFLRQNTQRFDLIFFDPPFHQDWAAQLLPVLADHLQPGGLLYLEREAQGSVPPNWQILRAGQAGQVEFFLMTSEVFSKPC